VTALLSLIIAAAVGIAAACAIRAWERKHGMPFFRIVKESDPDAHIYLPELRRRDRQN
jgi:hypothetical protein